MTIRMMDAVQGIQNAADAPHIALQLSRFAAQSGYEFWHIGRASTPDVPLAKKKLLDAWPLAWLRQYDQEQLIRNDAIWHACKASSRSFRWSDVAVRDDRSRRVMAIAKIDYSMRDGFCVPYHGLDGYQGGISFAGRDIDGERRTDLALEVVAIFAFNRLNEIRALEPRPRLLTPRQREVMQWVAAGKTAWDIAAILSISEQTVRTTAKAAMGRLNVSTRAQAIAEALRLKEISL